MDKLKKNQVTDPWDNCNCDREYVEHKIIYETQV